MTIILYVYVVKVRKIIQSLGPGIMFASTAIGVSHLVQSTRAGADYGFSFLWAIIIANILKYPFFEFGSRYANATGKSILVGYKNKNSSILVVYFLLSVSSMLIVTSAVTFVTSGLFINLLNVNLSTEFGALILLVICSLVLFFGGFNSLDKVLKIVGIVLFLSTLLAFVFTIGHGPVEKVTDFLPKNPYNKEGQLFLIALMGWMPTAVDLSTWNSIWTVEKIKNSKEQVTMKETLFDFNFGYWMSAVLSFCFLTLGAYLMYGTGEEISNKAPVFANQLINLFTGAFGKWSYPIIAVSAFSVMFSTTITVMDGYGRAMSETLNLLLNKKLRSYGIWLLILTVGSFVVIQLYLSKLKMLVDIATILSFVIAPFIAVINFWVVNSKEVKQEHKPGLIMKVLSFAGIIYLLVFTVYFIKIFFFD